MVIIKNSNIDGKGVFATEDIKIGTILQCDVLQTNDKILKDYLFPFIGSSTCIHIGFGSFLNSSKTPNLKHLKIDTVEKISYFEVIQDIKINEELTLNYL